MNTALLILIGALAGLLGGMMGIGGAIIIIPALVLLLGFSQNMAQGTTLLMLVMPVSAVAAWYYYKRGFADVHAAAILGVAFIAGSFLGAKIALHISTASLQKAFAVILVMIAVKLFLNSR